jgi:hypothetical protein
MVETRWSSRSGPSGALCMGFDKLLYHSEMRGIGIKVRKKQIVWRDIHANRTQTLRMAHQPVVPLQCSHHRNT